MAKYVNAYLVTLAFGGREEGGWWYDEGEVIESVATEAPDALRDLWAATKYSNQGRRPKSSVLSDGVYEIRIEDGPGADFPVRRPHYE